MRVLPVAALAAALSCPVAADVPEALDRAILPAFGSFAAATAALSAAAAANCTPAGLRPAYHVAFDAWMGVSHLTLGPIEDQGLTLAIAFWPDPRGQDQRALNALFGTGDPAALAPGAFADQSVAVRGFPTLERLLFTEHQDLFRCALKQAVAADLAGMARAAEAGWRDDFAATLLTAGEDPNPRYLSVDEARQALFTALMTGWNSPPTVGSGARSAPSHW